MLIASPCQALFPMINVLPLHSQYRATNPLPQTMASITKQLLKRHLQSQPYIKPTEMEFGPSRLELNHETTKQVQRFQLISFKDAFKIIFGPVSTTWCKLWWIHSKSFSLLHQSYNDNESGPLTIQSTKSKNSRTCSQHWILGHQNWN